MRLSLGRGERAFWQLAAVIVNVPRPGKPDFFAHRVVHDMFQGPPQRAESVGLANDHRVKGKAKDKRLFFALREHLFELVDDSLGEVVGALLAHKHLG